MEFGSNNCQDQRDEMSPRKSHQNFREKENIASHKVSKERSSSSRSHISSSNDEAMRSIPRNFNGPHVNHHGHNNLPDKTPRSPSRGRGHKSITKALPTSPELAPITDVKMLTQLIIGYGSKGRWAEALACLKRAQTSHGNGDAIAVDRYVYNAALSALAKAGEWPQALKLIKEMLRSPNSELAPDSYSHSSVISALAKGRQWQRASEYFEKHCEGGGGIVGAGGRATVNAHVYNALAHAMARGGKWKRALGVLTRMREAAVSPDVYTYSTLITACVRANQPEVAKRVYGQMRADGINANMITLTAMIPIYAKAGDWQTALKTYQALSALTHSSRKPLAGADVTSLGAVVSALSVNGQVQRAEALVAASEANSLSSSAEGSLMQPGSSQYAPQPNVVVYNGLLRGYAMRGLWEKSLATLRRMEDRSVHPDRSTYTEIINSMGPSQYHIACAAYMKLGCGPRSRDMPLIEKAANLGSVALPVRSHSSSDDGRSSRCLCDTMTETANSLLRVLASSGSADEAYELLSHLEHSRVPIPDAYSYSLTMKALSRAGRYRDALDVYNQAEASCTTRGGKVKVGNILCTAGVQVANKLGEWELAFNIFNKIERPDPFAVQNVMYALEAAGQWEKAVRIIESLAHRTIHEENEYKHHQNNGHLARRSQLNRYHTASLHQETGTAKPILTQGAFHSVCSFLRTE